MWLGKHRNADFSVPSSTPVGTPLRTLLTSGLLAENRYHFRSIARTADGQGIANIAGKFAGYANPEHSRWAPCFMGMADPFNRAENWRDRADELRDLAARTGDPVAAASLADMADALEQHARKLEEMALKMRCTRRVRVARAPLRHFTEAAD